MNIPTYLSNPAKRASNKIFIEKLAELAGVQSMDDFDEVLLRTMGDGVGVYKQVYEEAIREGASKYEAEESALSAEYRARDAYDKALLEHIREIESAAENLLAKYGLALSERGRGYKYTVVPVVSWDDAAKKIMQTINGVGDFHFSSLHEFLASGPYTAREAVLTHLSWMRA